MTRAMIAIIAMLILVLDCMEAPYLICLDLRRRRYLDVETSVVNIESSCYADILPFVIDFRR